MPAASFLFLCLRLSSLTLYTFNSLTLGFALAKRPSTQWAGAKQRAPAWLVALVLLTASPGWAGIIPDSDAWERWRPAAEAEEITVDHSEWGVLLNKYLRVDAESGINRFDYAAVNTADKALLASYIESLSATSVAQLTRAQQQAYWINLYNALTIQLILDNPGVKSIRKIKDGFFSIGPWGIELIEVDGQVLTLNDIEHRILRPLYGDARVHFAVNCASLGCPNLQPEPWEADTLDAQYDRAAREFIAHPRGALVEADRITLSSIFKWFSEDFGDDRQAVLRWISQFADADKAERLRNYTGRVRYDYDWALNAP